MIKDVVCIKNTRWTFFQPDWTLKFKLISIFTSVCDFETFEIKHKQNQLVHRFSVSCLTFNLSSWYHVWPFHLHKSNERRLTFETIMFILLTVFGMNVGGVPWTGQTDPELADGFRNVMLLSVSMLLLVLLCFLFPYLHNLVTTWRRPKTVKRSWSLNHRSFLKKRIDGEERGGYLRL